MASATSESELIRIASPSSSSHCPEHRKSEMDSLQAQRGRLAARVLVHLALFALQCQWTVAPSPICSQMPVDRPSCACVCVCVCVAARVCARVWGGKSPAQTQPNADATSPPGEEYREGKRAQGAEPKCTPDRGRECGHRVESLVSAQGAALAFEHCIDARGFRVHHSCRGVAPSVTLYRPQPA